MNSTAGARDATRIQANLMSSLSSKGLPILGGSLRYAQGELNRLDRAGLAPFVQRGYKAAQVAAMEQAQLETDRARAGFRGGMGNSAFYRAAPAFAGAAEAYAKENASIQSTKAMTTLSQRHQMLNAMTGGGAQALNLSAGFGGLTNRGLAAGLNAGNPAYEGIVGGTAALAPILLTALQRDPSFYNTAGQKSFLSDWSQGQRFVPAIG